MLHEGHLAEELRMEQAAVQSALLRDYVIGDGFVEFIMAGASG